MLTLLSQPISTLALGVMCESLNKIGEIPKSYKEYSVFYVTDLNEAASAVQTNWHN